MIKACRETNAIRIVKIRFIVFVQCGNDNEFRTIIVSVLSLKSANYIMDRPACSDKPCNEQQIIEAVQQAAQSIYTRRQLQQMEPTCAGVARPEYSETVQKVVDYLEKHYSDAALSLKGLAANYLFMNPDYVSRQFLQQTGYRFVDYLLALRIRKAQWLLVNGVPPQQVPERVGYSANPQYFVHLFSKATGMTPREYAQALRIEP